MLAIDLTDPTVVSPGTAGFITVFILALALLVLLRSMVGHLRKVRYQAEREAAEQQAAEQRAGTDGSSAPSATTSSGRPTAAGEGDPSGR